MQEIRQWIDPDDPRTSSSSVTYIRFNISLDALELFMDDVLHSSGVVEHTIEIDGHCIDCRQIKVTLHLLDLFLNVYRNWKQLIDGGIVHLLSQCWSCGWLVAEEEEAIW